MFSAPRVGGAEFAHQLINTGKNTLKYMAISSKSDVEICEYPDSGKFLAKSDQGGSGHFRFVGKMEDTREYFEGEDGE